MKLNNEPRYNKTMSTNQIVGYVVKSRSSYVQYVHHDAQLDHNYLAASRPEPVALSDAYRRLAAFIDENEGEVEHDDLYVAAVFYEPKPVERMAQELGGLLQSLASRHGHNLGLTSEQIEKQIVKELEELSAGGKTFIATGIPRIG